MTHTSSDDLFAATDAGAMRAVARTAGWATDDSRQPNRDRGLVADRLAVVGRRHARHRTEQDWRGQPIGPHAVAFFYRQPVDGLDRIKIATRLFCDGDDVADLPAVLDQLHELALDYLASDGLDPRVQLTNRTEQMHPDAEFLGVGVSTLNPDGPPPDRSQQAAAVAFRALGLLTDGTQLRVRCAGGLQPTHTCSSHNLDVDLGISHARPWRWAPPSFLRDDPTLNPIVEALAPLCTAVQLAQHSRPPARRRWRRA